MIYFLHPFLSTRNLRYAFQDHSHIFMAIDLLDGGDLRYHLLNHKFSESEVKYIFSELACGIEYIHRNNIIHRDMKPENSKFKHYEFF